MRTWTGTAGALAVLLTASTAPATADGGTERRSSAGAGTRTIQVEVTYGMPPGRIDGASCTITPAGAGPASCSLLLSGRTTFWGTIEAHGPWDAVVTPRPDGTMTFTGNNYLTGTIRGCGSGRFVYEDVDGTIDRFDPVTRSAAARNAWRIRPETAEGQLAGRLVSGQGTQEWRSYPLNLDEEEQDWGHGTIRGTIVCRVPAERSSRRPS